jgi:hypothetical protein
MCENEIDISQKDDLDVNRGVLGLFESFTEEEYKESKCMHYSLAKDILYNPQLLTEERKEQKKEWFVFGTLVDIILTDSDNITDRVVINDKVPTEQFERMANYLLENDLLPNKLVSDVVGLSEKQINDIYTNSGSKVNYKIDTKREKIINECGDYLELLLTSEDKLIVTTNMFNEASKVAEVFSSHRWSEDLFMSKADQVRNHMEIYYQFKIRYVFEDVRCKSKIDIVVIDHDLKTISPYDIKTGSDLPVTFIKEALYKYKYGYQGVMYRDGLKNFIKGIPALKDYSVDNFRFVYVSRLRPTYPIILKMGDACHQEFRDFGIESPLYDIPALMDVFEAITFYMKQLDEGKPINNPYPLIASLGEVIINHRGSKEDYVY